MVFVRKAAPIVDSCGTTNFQQLNATELHIEMEHVCSGLVMFGGFHAIFINHDEDWKKSFSDSASMVRTW